MEELTLTIPQALGLIAILFLLLACLSTVEEKSFIDIPAPTERKAERPLTPVILGQPFRRIGGIK